MTQQKGFHIVRRPEGIVSQFERIVVDGQGHPHLALTRLYQQLRQELSDGTAHTYLSALLPYFTFLDSDPWRQQRQDQWDSPPESVQEAVLRNRSENERRITTSVLWTKNGFQNPSTILPCTYTSVMGLHRPGSAGVTRLSYAWLTNQAHALLSCSLSLWEIGGNEEAAACSKGSHGRRVKVIRFSMETAKLLHSYVNDDRVRVDPRYRTLAQLDD